MQHLDPERLAAFDHEAPSPGELAHLAACGACRAERAAFDELAAFAERSAHDYESAGAAPLTEWDALAGRLRSEGLLRPRRTSARALLRYAAGFVLVIGGVLGGRVSVGASALPFLASASTGGDLPIVSVSADADGASAFRSVGQANDVLDRAQRDYERASLWLAANDTTVRGSDVYRARLAALDQMMAASRAGLRDAPQDPLLSQYYRAAYAAREATLQQLGSALPVDKTIEGY